MITLGFVLAVAIPAVVLVGTVLWPERIPEDRTVNAIQARIESERTHRKGRRTGVRRPPWSNSVKPCRAWRCRVESRPDLDAC